MVRGHLLSSGFPHVAANMAAPGVISGSPNISGLWARVGDVGAGVGCITRVPCPVPTPDPAVGVVPEALQEAGSSFLKHMMKLGEGLFPNQGECRLDKCHSRCPPRALYFPS